MLNCPVGKHCVPDQLPVRRRLAAILAGDVAGYSRLIGVDEIGTLNALKAIRRELADPAIAAHRGRVVKTTGDGILIEFPSVVDAVACAVAIQYGMEARNVDVPEDKRIVFRIGINIGDIIIDEAGIHGDAKFAPDLSRVGCLTFVGECGIAQNNPALCHRDWRGGQALCDPVEASWI
jgi:class 3 adenylate cyclase